MAVSFVAASSGTSVAGTSTSFATTLPTGWAAGDVAILTGHVSATNLTMSTPAGWTAITGVTNPTNESTNSRVYAWSRVLQAGDTAPTITNSGAVTGGWEMAAYRGADTSSPIGQASTATAAATSATLPTLTGVGADSALHSFAHARVASGTIPSGLTFNAAYTEVVDVATSRTTGNANLRLAGAYRLISSAGSYGSESVAVANSVSSSMVLGLVEVKSAATAVSGSADLASSGSLSASALVVVPAGAALDAGTAVTATPAVRLPAGGSVAASGVLSASGTVVRPASAVLAAQGTLAAQSGSSASGGAALSAGAALTAAGVVLVRAAAPLAGGGVLAAAASVRAVGGAGLVAGGAVSVSAQVLVFASADLAGGSGLAVSAGGGGPVVRPDVGAVSRPAGGVVVRPNTGVVPRVTSAVVRPDDGVVVRP